MLNPNSNKEQQKSSTFMETLQDKLKDIKNFSNWSAKEQMVAVAAVGVIFGALLPVVAVALPVAATGAIVALTLFFAVKAVEYGYKGLKWSAEKTWEGAKYLYGKAKDLGKKAKDSVERKASKVSLSLSGTFANAVSETNYYDELNKLTPEQKRQSQEIRNDLKEIFNDKKKNSELIKNIFPSIILKVGSEDQKRRLNSLGQSGLHRLLTTTSTLKEQFSLDKIFSEHYSEIKEVIEEHKTYNLSRSSSMSSLVSASSSEEHKGVKTTSSLKEAANSEHQVLPESLTSGYGSEGSSPNSSGSSTPEERSSPVKTLIKNFNALPLIGRGQPIK